MADPAAPAVPDIAYEFADSRDRLTLTFGEKRMELGVREVQNLIQFLGAIRAAMTPPVEAGMPTEAFLSVETPPIVVRPTADMRHAGLIARTPQYGWIAFHLDKAQADGLGRHLAELATSLQSTN